MKFFPCFLCFIFILGIEAEEINFKKPSPEDITFFENKVRPLLSDKCFKCHGATKQKGHLRLDSMHAMLDGGDTGPAIIIGDPEKSPFIVALSHSEELKMPPKKKLSAEQIATLTDWVKRGAPWPNTETYVRKVEKGRTFTPEEKKFWAYNKAQDPTIPTVLKKDWVSNPIDNFVLSKLEGNSFEPATETSKLRYIRRATFDLHGLPPTPDEIDEFLKDQRPEAYEKLLDRLLASPRYGERWGRHWLDVARYADSNGQDENIAFLHSWRYRDYVINSFNKDKPYNEFVMEQIAGDLMPLKDGEPFDLKKERIIATGFLSIGPKMLADDDPKKKQMDIIDEQITTLTQAFLGLTMGCARCHDHKFEPLLTKDYYALAGILKSTKTMETLNVVAKWHEHDISSPEQKKAQAEHKKATEENDKAIKNFSSNTAKEIANKEWPRIDEYKNALAEIQNKKLNHITDGSFLLGNLLNDKQLQEKAIVVEAESSIDKVNVDTKGVGKGIGIIQNKSKAKYEIDIKEAGRYILEIRFAAKDLKPFKIRLNGKEVFNKACNKTTGGWHPQHQQWQTQGVLTLRKGKNTFNFDKVEAKVDKFILVKQEISPSSLKAIAHYDKKNNKANALNSIVIEAKKFTKAENYRKLDHFISPGEGQKVSAKWNFNIPHEGDYQLEVIYASNNERPVTVSIDGDNKGEFLKAKTGGWGTGNMRVSPLFISKFTAGKHSIKIKRQNHSGNISYIVLTPVFRKEKDELKEYAREKKLNLGILRQIMAGNLKNKEAFVIQDGVEHFYTKENKELLSSLKKSQAELKKNIPEIPMAMGVIDAKEIADTKVHLRGSYLFLGEDAPRQIPSIFNTGKESKFPAQQSGRLELAKWIGGKENPLTSRVMVNRIWRWHFGEGIVRSPDNFGMMGEKPDNEKLLNWLSHRFTENNWSVKFMHKMIMLSSTYKMGTRHNSAYAQKDPENRLMWRFSRKRLEAEAIRDSILYICDDLDETMGGTLLNYKKGQYVVKEPHKVQAYKANRRSVYIPIQRSAVYPVLQAFDFPDPSTMNGDRASTTVAPQALFLMNSELVDTRATSLLNKLINDKNFNFKATVKLLYKKIINRDPSSQEVERSVNYITMMETNFAQHDKDTARINAWKSFTRALFCSNEFMYVE